MHQIIQAVIVDDDRKFLEVFEKRLRAALKPGGFEVRTEIYTNGSDVQADLDLGKCSDLWFLDIEMPAPDGFSLAAGIRERDPEALIVFVSVHEHLALQSYRYHPYYFLSKLRLERDFPRLMEEIRDVLGRREPRFYTIQEKTRVEQLPLDRILYIEKSGKYVSFIITDRSPVSERISLAEALLKLPASEFLQVTRNRAVNLRQIASFPGNTILLLDGQKLTVPEGRVPEIRSRIRSALGKESAT